MPAFTCEPGCCFIEIYGVPRIKKFIRNKVKQKWLFHPVLVRKPHHVTKENLDYFDVQILGLLSKKNFHYRYFYTEILSRPPFLEVQIRHNKGVADLMPPWGRDFVLRATISRLRKWSFWHTIAGKIKERRTERKRVPFLPGERKAGLSEKDRERQNLLKKPYFQGARIFCLRNRLIQRPIRSRAASRK